MQQKKQSSQRTINKLYKNFQVELYLIRHGYSISNRATTGKSTLNIKGLQKALEADPSLTRTGIKQSIHASNNTKIKDINPDYIFTSVLCRAQQTALLMFPSDKELIVAPYLKEKNNRMIDTDNKPFKDIFTQYEKRHNFLSDTDLRRFVYANEILEKNRCAYTEEARHTDGSIQNFVKDYLLDFLNKKPTQDVFKIVVVCHGGIIRDFLNVEKTCNNVVFKVNFQSNNINEKTYQVIHHGFAEFKLICDRKYTQKQGSDIVHLKYPIQQIISKQVVRKTREQLKQIFRKQLLKSQTNFGSRHSRINILLKQLRNPKPNQSTGIKNFRDSHKQLLKQNDDVIMEYFTRNNRQLEQLIFNIDEAFTQKLNSIKKFFHLENEDDAIKLLNRNIKGLSEEQIYEKIMTLPATEIINKIQQKQQCIQQHTRQKQLQFHTQTTDDDWQNLSGGGAGVYRSMS